MNPGRSFVHTCEYCFPEAGTMMPSLLAPLGSLVLLLETLIADQVLVL